MALQWSELSHDQQRSLYLDLEFPLWLRALRTQLVSMRMQVLLLASLSGLRIRRCHELWCRSQMQLGSGVAVAVAWAGGYSSDWTPSLETSICHECGPKKTKKKKLFLNITFITL